MGNAEKESTDILLKTRQEKLDELNVQQGKLQQLQSELSALESKIKNNEKLSKEDTNFVAELGWLAAAAVTIAAIADSI